MRLAGEIQKKDPEVFQIAFAPAAAAAALRLIRAASISNALSRTPLADGTIDGYNRRSAIDGNPAIGDPLPMSGIASFAPFGIPSPGAALGI